MDVSGSATALALSFKGSRRSSIMYEFTDRLYITQIKFPGE